MRWCKFARVAGAAGFMFFLVKGIVWLAVFAGAAVSVLRP